MRKDNIPILEPDLSGNEKKYITECIDTNWISSKGAFVTQFENIFEIELVKSGTALAVSNGTVALHLALVALGVGPGDEVIVPDMTFAATVNAVLYTGAVPVLVDIELDTLCIDPLQFEQAITPKTKAVIPVHLYGHPCNMGLILDIAKQNKLYVIEDCAEALGSQYKNNPVGSFGDAATFSFFANKTITTGEGGMVIFKNEDIAKKARVLRDHGMSQEKRYWHEVVGFNYRMTNLQAAIGVAQTERLESFINNKRKIAQYYNINFGELSHIDTPIEKEWAFSTYWLYGLKINTDMIELDEVVNVLGNQGVETRPFFYPLHVQPPYMDLKRHGNLENSKSLSNKGLCLPSSASLSRIDQDKIINILRDVF